jgi:NAD(P)-dependent dehydrogenase (short-subunit alcohol dehydrogenase family)
MSASTDVRFDGRVAIVTGAGRGLGREHALLLGSRGATVIVDDISAGHAERTASDVVAAGGRAQAVVTDVADPRACEELVTDTIDRHGRLDIVLNNAGSGGPTGPIDRVDDERLHAIVSTHLLGSFHLTRAAWPVLVAAGYGRILFTSSGSSLGAANMPAYSMAKGGLWGLTRALAIEGAPHGIRANALLPMGYTRAAARNPNEDTRRWMEHHFPPSLCAPAAAWLVHEDVPCTGELISTGAGRVARIATVGVPGFDGGPDLTLELLRDHWDEVVSMVGGRAVMSGRDELGFYQGPAAWRD